MKRICLRVGAAALIAFDLGCAYACADGVADFYKGKEIDLSIGFGPGAGYDLYSRVLASRLGDHIPGHPTVVPQNMPGGGGLTSANYLFNVAPKDGLHLAMFGSFNAMAPLYGDPSAKFDPRQFSWIGNMNVDVEACGVWRTSGVTDMKDMKTRSVTFGSSGRASTTSQHALALARLTGAKVKIVYGYQGTKDINLAMMRGEVSGSCGIYVSSAISEWADDLTSGKLKLIVQFGKKREPLFGDAVDIYDLINSENDRKAADLVFRPNEIGRPVAAPPGIPKDRLDALRKAFDETMKDPAFLAAAKTARLPINPTTGAEVSALFGSFYQEPKAVLDRAKDLIGVQ
jgi:tripartite-type tricarboxylate transporter receptor subunit TctC